MKVFVTGARGQLGWELQRSLASFGEILAPDREQLDLGDSAEVASYLSQHQPQLIANCAAYTAVDAAESDQANASAINTKLPDLLARYSADRGAALIHFSTDYVFGGTGQNVLREDDPTAPVNVYGATKLEGEQAVLASGCTALIFRTSWVYSSHGNNFMKTMLRAAQRHPELRVVNDQVGSPTSARSLADLVTAALAGSGIATAPDAAEALKPSSGLYHLCNSGHTSWHGFAKAIFDINSLITGHPRPEVRAIPTSEYPTPAARPLNSRLDTERFKSHFKLHPSAWRDALEQELQMLNDPRGI